MSGSFRKKKRKRDERHHIGTSTFDSTGSRCSPFHSSGPRNAMDLFVPMPPLKKTTTSGLSTGVDTTEVVVTIPAKVLLDRIISRLIDTGYTTIALTHTIYGRPREPEDRIVHTIPSEIIGMYKSTKIKLIRRLHVVMENVSDMAHFETNQSSSTLTSPSSPSLLDEYDIVSIVPRNELVFRAACATSATWADIVTLEGISSTNRLPYRIRTTDVKAVVNRGGVFEIPYAGMILNSTSRKGTIQTSHELRTASVGCNNVPVVLSSGNRIVNSIDMGPLALRTPGDLANFVHVVMGFDSRTASDSVSRSGQIALDNHAAQRTRQNSASNVPGVRVKSVSIHRRNELEDTSSMPSITNTVFEMGATSAGMNLSHNDETKQNTDNGDVDQVEDGFISF